MYLGIDFGTSGVRCCVLDERGTPISQSHAAYPEQTRETGKRHEQQPEMWWQTLKTALGSLDVDARESSRHIAIDGTSGTVLALDGHDRPLGAALMYNDARASTQASVIDQLAPMNSAARGASSGLAKMLWLTEQNSSASRFVHQADWVTGKLLDDYRYSDENNALKSGYDPLERAWPQWVFDVGITSEQLPEVLEPGSVLGQVNSEVACELGLSPALCVHAGTTDSIAAFLASPASMPGDAVTSLGSTLAIKLISKEPVFSAELGIYSHRLGSWWLVGGASNSGGAALLRHFTARQLEELSRKLPLPTPDPGFYPLPGTGERFPLANPDMASKTEPRPASDAEFLQGLLQGMSNIETLAYQRLSELGAPSPRRIFTSGGGARNHAWLMFRQQRLPCDVFILDSSEPACGAARLARGLEHIDQHYDC